MWVGVVAKRGKTSLALVAVITRTSFNQRNVHPQSQQMFGDYVLKAMP